MTPGTRPLFYLLLVLDLILKGITLYKSAQRDQKAWFIALLIVNSLGILPIIYLLANKDIQLSKTTVSTKTVAKKTTKRAKR